MNKLLYVTPMIEIGEEYMLRFLDKQWTKLSFIHSLYLSEKSS